MSFLAAAVRRAVSFVAGDDPVIAFGAAAGIGVVALVAALGVAAWWILPVLVPALILLRVR
jgi:hypothetical protein